MGIRLPASLCLIAHLWLGCGGGGPSDAEHYAAALGAADAARCGRVRAAATRDECLSAVAVALARARNAEGATAACAQLSSGSRWRDECHFSLADELGLVGSAAVQTCQQAGQYQQDCINHAAAREVEQRLLSQGPRHGQERETTQRMVGILKGYMSEGEAHRMAHSMTISWLARRDDGQVFRPESCGNFDANICTQVYILRARGGELYSRADASWRSRCDQPLTAAVAEQDAELPEFAPEMGEVVQRAWAVLCSEG